MAVASTIDYDRGDRTVARTIAPLGLVLKAGVWYIVALSDDSLRTYRVGRVAGARRLDEPFERPDDFDLATFWAESSAAYERDAPRVEVTVRVREDRIGWLRRAVGGPAVDRAVRLPVEDPEDWQHLRLRIDWPDEVPAFLLSVGPGLEVLDPPDIRQQTIDLARATVAHYAGSGGSGGLPAG